MLLKNKIFFEETTLTPQAFPLCIALLVIWLYSVAALSNLIAAL